MERLFFIPGPTVSLPALTVGSSTMDRRGLLCLSKAMVGGIVGKGMETRGQVIVNIMGKYVMGKT